MSDRKNITDREQDQLEEATFEGGIPVQIDGTQRVITKGRQGGTERTANDGQVQQKNAGVVMPHDDKPGRFVEETQGKA
jgi:hypothetical protein